MTMMSGGAWPLGYPPLPPLPPRNGLGTSALVLGIVGLALSWIPVVGYLAFVLGIVATVLGFAGLSRVKKGAADNRGSAIAGAVLGLLTIVASILFYAAWLHALS